MVFFHAQATAGMTETSSAIALPQLHAQADNNRLNHKEDNLLYIVWYSIPVTIDGMHESQLCNILH